MTHVALLIKERRTELGISQSELSRNLGVTRAAINNIESTKIPCPPNWIADLAKILKLSHRTLIKAFVLDYENELIFRIKALKKYPI